VGSGQFLFPHAVLKLKALKVCPSSFPYRTIISTRFLAAMQAPWHLLAFWRVSFRISLLYESPCAWSELHTSVDFSQEVDLPFILDAQVMKRIKTYRGFAPSRYHRSL
jgi:hypothetical protein